MATIFYSREDVNQSKFIFDVIRERNSKKLHRTIILAPKQFTFQIERDAFRYMGNSAVMAIDVMGFQRLGNQIVKSAGGDVEKIGVAGRKMIVSKIVRSVRDDFRAFREVADNEDFLQMLCDGMADLKRQNTSSEDLNEVLNKLEEWVGGSLFLLIFVILVAQIFFRQVLHHPLIWSEEAARLLFFYVGMLGVSIGIRSQQHVLIDFITSHLPATLRVWVFSLAQLIIFSAILLLFYYGVTVFTKASDQLVSLGISNKWLYLSLPVCAVLMFFRFLQAQQENYRKGDSRIPVWIYIVLAAAVLLVAFIEPSWFNALRISEYVKFSKSSVYVALIIWLVIMFAGVPVGWSLFIAAVLFFSMTRWGTGNFAATKLVDSVNSFGLLSVPFFILTGILMNSAGITTRIFNFALAMLGHYTGGMGHVNIAASLIFSGMSGSA